MVFDLDGTLLNTLEDLKEAACHALSEAGLPEITLEQTRLYVGNGVRNLMLRSVYGPEFVRKFGDIALAGSSREETKDGKRGVRDTYGRFFELPAERDQFENILDSFKKYYADHLMVNTRPYDGVAQMLGELGREGYSVAVVSNKFDAAVKNLCAHFFPDVKVAVGQQENIAKKPAPDMVFEALRKLGKSTTSAVYAGDSEVDVETAKNAGMKCIACLWGFRDKETLLANGARTFAETPNEIVGLLERMP